MDKRVTPNNNNTYEAKLVLITPDVAKELLSRNTDNYRNVDHHTVTDYASQMLAGDWDEMNGDTIKIFANGVFADGQHRMHAIVKSGVSIKYLVVTGVLGTGVSIDRGRKRNLAQILKRNGYKNTKSIAASARLCIIHDKGMWGLARQSSHQCSDKEILRFLEKHKDSMGDAQSLARISADVVTQSLTAAVVFLGCRRIDITTSDIPAWFCRSLATGVGLTENDAVLHLRNRFLAQSRASRIDRDMQRALVTMAWNKTVSGEVSRATGFRIVVSGPRQQKFPDKVLEIEPEQELFVAANRRNGPKISMDQVFKSK